MAAERNVSNEEVDFAQNFADTLKNVEENTIIQATVDSVDGDTVYLDIGFKSEAKVPVTEFDKTPVKGDVVEVYLVRVEGRDDGEPVVSMAKAKQYKERFDLRDLIRDNVLVEGVVTEIKKFAVQVKYKNLFGSIPFGKFDIKRIEDFSGFKGQKIQFYIDDVLEQKEGLKKGAVQEEFIGNRRRYLSQKSKTDKKEFFEKFNVGDVFDGVVKNIQSFGAFVDLGSVEGLLHIKDISWVKVEKVEDVLKVGSKIKVKILAIDKDKEQLSLGVKQLEEHPWEKFIKQYKEEDVVKGVVTDIKPYGAFVKIIDGVEALLHISDMSWTKNIKHPKELVTKGQQVELKIISIDAENKKVNVSIKHMLQNPWDAVAEKYKEGTVVKGKIKSITSFGAFVELEEGIDALLHKEEISWSEIPEPKDFFKEGQVVEAKVIFLDSKENRIKLGIKQLSDDPWKKLEGKYKEGEVADFVIKEINDEAGVVVELVPGFDWTIAYNFVGFGKPEDARDAFKAAYKVGDKVKAAVKSYDTKKKNILISIKDYEKMKERKKVDEFQVDKKDDKFTLGDLLNSKKD